jgi:hypothetical protein
MHHFLHMETLHIGLAILATALITSGIVRWLTREERTRRALAAPIVKVRDVKEGATVRVTGKLILGNSILEAPFSHRECAHYDAILEERYVEDWRDTWHTVAHETNTCGFFVEDETGRIEVDATRVEGVVVRDHHKTKGEIAEDKAKAFLSKHGQRSSIPPGRNLRYREGVLEAGETVTVQGTARSSTHSGGKHLVLCESKGPVRASDDPDLVA